MPEMSMARAIARVAERGPDRPAATHEGTTIPRGGLERAPEHLARHERPRSVEAGAEPVRDDSGGVRRSQRPTGRRAVPGAPA